jgi:hypothetical protein
MNGRHSRTAAIVLGFIIIVALIGACAGASDGRDGRSGLDGFSNGSNEQATGGAAPPPDGLPVDAGPAGVPGKSGETGSTVEGDGASNLVKADQPLIIKTGTLRLEVTDIPTVLSKARSAIAGLGGYVSGSQESNESDQSVAVITYRVPADRWDEALSALRALAAKVVTEQTEAVEVTGQVLDLGARIENLKVTEQALQTIMDQAAKISDVLEVQAQLTAVRGEIEQLATQKAHLEAQAALGTLTATYTVPVAVVTTAAQGWSLAAELDRAAGRLVELGQSLASAAVWAVVVGLPILLLVLIFAVPIIFVLRRAARRVGRPRPPAPLWGPPAAGSAVLATTGGEPPAGGPTGPADVA